MKYAIVCVGYNRPDSMRMLLDSVKKADYGDFNVDLIVSVDRGKRHKEVADLARSIEWNHGKKTIIEFSERIGLKNHILRCGDLSAEFDAIVVLEDDLIVSPYFFDYVVQNVNKYNKDNRISGISLYKHLFNPGARRLFESDNNGFDVYLMQFAQSWGQCWTSKMWSSFRNWYTNNSGFNFDSDSSLPMYIKSWDNHSWLKYFMLYNVQNDKYFVYPQISLTSNTSKTGQHNARNSNDYQVPLLNGRMEYYRLPDFEEAIKYDVYFERMGIEHDVIQDLHGRKVLDLYGLRNDYSNIDYLISTKVLPFEIVKKISLCQRPIERNLFSPSSGEGIYVYDMHKSSNNKQIDSTILTRYEVKGILWKRLFKLSVSEEVENQVTKFKWIKKKIIRSRNK